MHDIKCVGILSKPKAAEGPAIVPELVRWLEKRGLGVVCDEVTAAYGAPCGGHTREEVARSCDLLIVLGGDGTLLAAARSLEGRQIPVFPVNLGGLGFLTAITTEEIYPELERALRNEHRIGHRGMLQCQLVRNHQTVASFHALNDVVVTKASIARMVDFEVFVDTRFMCAYKADGLIVSTPTGSTAYSLSAGGPIIFPKVNALCLTPICPHMLTNRPVIVPDTSLITLINLTVDAESFLTIDGQVGEPLETGDEVMCRRSKHTLNLIRPPRSMFFDVLRQKLKWGER